MEKPTETYKLPPFMGVDMPAKQAPLSDNANMAIGFAFLAVVGLGGYALVTSESAADLCGDKAGAWIMAQEAVKTKLKAPSTASFPWFDEAFVSTDGDCSYVVAAHVDAENGFGAQIRSRFVVALEHVPESGGYRIGEVAIR